MFRQRLLENAGAVLNDVDLGSFYSHPRVLGLAEVMDFPAVRDRDEDMIAKIFTALEQGKQIDGHCAGLDDVMMTFI